MQRREIIRRHYETRVHPARDGYEILDWASPEAQEARFLVLANLLPHADSTTPAGHQPASGPAESPAPGHTLPVAAKSPRLPAAKVPPVPTTRPLRLLDVGCGLADLATYLEKRHIRVAYTGVDLTPGILCEAHRRRPGTALLLADVMEAAPFQPRAFDVVFASGVFNLQLGNNEAFVRRALPHLFRLAATALVVNFLHRRAAQPYPHCHYYDPVTVQGLLRRGVSQSELFDDYLENDFTVVYWR